MNSVRYVLSIKELVMEIASHLNYKSITNFYIALHKPIDHCFVKRVYDIFNGECNMCYKRDPQQIPFYQIKSMIYCYHCIEICCRCHGIFPGEKSNCDRCHNYTCNKCDEYDDNDYCCQMYGFVYNYSILEDKKMNSTEIINKFKNKMILWPNEFKILYDIASKQCFNCSIYEYMNICHDCDKILCDKCYEKCSSCKRLFCGKEMHLISCANKLCKKSNCANCVKECKKCHTKLCESHLLKCYFCEESTCRKCFGYSTNDYVSDVLDNGKCLNCTGQYHKWKKTRKLK